LRGIRIFSASSALHPTYCVNLRIRDDIRALIARAAKTFGKSRSEFMMDTARRVAEDALLDQPPSGADFDRLMAASKPWLA